MPSRAHDELVGRSFGEFVLRERIGEGGFGAVYRATQPALDREAVVKVLHARLHASPAATERFLREAKLASKLDHPFAAHIYAFGAEPDGELWIAMELVRGTPLDRLLKIQGPLPLERFVPLLDRICEVVHTAHEQGIVHRDLKPANVMVITRAGRLLPKLLDFGIAKGLGKEPAGAATGDTQLPVEPELDVARTASSVEMLDTVASATDERTGGELDELTQRGALIGSPAYMAPEQWVDAGDVDARTDLYALGVLAYECLTGKPPFTGTTISLIAQQHAKQPVPPLGPGFPPALDDVFAKAVAKEPEARYGDALAFAAAFRQSSGVAAETFSVPALDAAVRDAAITGAPPPIAESIAALEAARNAHQARDAFAMVARAITRYLALLALACRSRVSADEPHAVGDALRTLYRRPLDDHEWLELARLLASSWLERRDAYPVPELVDALHDRFVIDTLRELSSLGDRTVSKGGSLVEVLESAAAQLSKLLGALAFVRDYPMVLVSAPRVAERWMGVRRTQRSTVAMRAGAMPVGMVALLDHDGGPVLSLAPLFQVTAPTPGAPLELFLFEGRDARGARFVTLPDGFEHHDAEVWEWFRGQLASWLDETEATATEDSAPYRGLRAFSTGDGASFFGREKLVDAFLNRLKLQTLLAVVGRSGAGKSSFVHAGVVPALPSGWRAITLRPGASPLGALAGRLEHAGVSSITRASLAADKDALGDVLRADAARRGPLVLVIDQLEEIFTLCPDAGERATFCELIASAARGEDDPVRVVFTLRDDFLVRTEQIPALRNRIGHGLQLLTVPGADDLRRILTEPARRAGYELEGELAAEMVAEVADQPGALALISFTAQKLWELRDRHFKQLTRAAYKTLGGVGGALAHHADVTLDAMPPDQRALAREAFRHLVTSQNTRTVLARKDLHQLLGGAEHVERVIEQLIAARLLVASENDTGAETIEIIHEALLVAWPRLVEWRREDAEGARFREQLRTAAAQWQERGRAKGLLWRGDALAEYVLWRGRHAGPLTDLEAAFADASQADAARGQRNRRLLLATAFTALVAVVVGLVVFNARIAGQRRELQANLQHQVEDQGRRLLLGGDPLQALAYLDNAALLGARGPAHDFLVAQAVAATGGELFEVHHGGSAGSPRFSSDGTRLVTAGIDHEARVWDLRTRSEIATLPHLDQVVVARFAPDDSTILTASFDGTAVVWDARTGKSVHTFRHGRRVWCAEYGNDGTVAITAGEDDVVALWNLADGSARLRVHGTGAGMVACALSPDGHTIVATDRAGTLRWWNARTGELLHEIAKVNAPTLRFTSDGTRLVTSSFDGPAAVWDVASGDKLHSLAHKAQIYSAEPSPNGKLVVTASDDHTAVVWDASTGEPRFPLPHPAAVKFAAFSPDGKYIVTACADASARLWDVSTGRLAARWRGHQEAVTEAVFDATGQRVVTAGDDGNAIVWRVAPQEHVTWIATAEAQVAASFSPDGTRLVTAADSSSVHVWDTTSSRELLALRAHEGGLSSIGYSPDGRLIATASHDGTVQLWDASTGAPAGALEHGEALLATKGRYAGNQLAWSPDGSSLVVGSDDGRLRCWNAATRKLRFENTGHGGRSVMSAAFGADNTSIATVGADGTIRVWSLSGELRASYPDPYALIAKLDPIRGRILDVQRKQRAEILAPASSDATVELVGHGGWINAAGWTPDGILVVTGSLDGTARIWDPDTGDALAILEHPTPVQFVTLSADGDRVALVGEDGGIAIHELPRTPVDPLSLPGILRCRVPYEVRDNRLQNRAKDPLACTE